MDLKQIIRVSISCLTTIVLINFSNLAFATFPDGQANTPQSSKEKLHRFIIQFKSQGPHALKKSASYLFKNDKKFKLETVDQSDSLDKLNQMYGVTSFKRMFFTKDIVDIQQSGDIQEFIVKRIKSKFAKRNKRSIKSEIPDLTNTYVFQVPAHVNIEDVIASYSADVHVEYVQQDDLIRGVPLKNEDDSLMAEIKNGFEKNWLISQGEGVVVAVVGPGANYENLKIKNNAWVNFAEVANNGVDDDENGFVDDVYGYNFQGQNNYVLDAISRGDYLAQTIAEFAPKIKIMPVKVTSDDGQGYVSDLSEGLVYAAANGADVVESHWECFSQCSSSGSVDAAMKFVHGLGSVVILSGVKNAALENFSPSYLREVVVSDHPAVGAAVAALVLAHNMNLTNEDVKQILIKSLDHNVHYDGQNSEQVSQALTFDLNNLLNVRIAEPKSNAVVSGQDLIVKGTVGGDQFKEYAVFVKNVASGDWVEVLSSTNTMANDLLATINLGPLPKNQFYLLKLTAVSKTEDVFEDVVIFYHKDSQNNPPKVKIGHCSSFQGCSNFYLYVYGLDREDGLVDHALYRINQGPWRFVEYGRIYLPSLGLDEKEYTLEAKAIDSDGLESSVSQFVIENTKFPPAIEIDHWNYDISTQKINFWLKMPGDKDIQYGFIKYVYRVDGGEWSSLLSAWPTFDIMGLTDGSHQIEMKSVSREGDESKVTLMKFNISSK